MNKQYNINRKDRNFTNILSLAKPSNFVKICDYCSEIFQADVSRNSFDGIRCPICFSLYFAVHNELNDFWYLEFVRNPADAFVISPKPKDNKDFILK